MTPPHTPARRPHGLARGGLGPALTLVTALAACGGDPAASPTDTADDDTAVADTGAPTDATVAADAAPEPGDVAPDATEVVPTPVVQIYGVDGNTGDYLGDGRERPRSLVGMSGTIPGAPPTAEFAARVRAFDPDVGELAYAPESYDAVVVAALAAESARSDVAADLAPFVPGVTARGTKCATFAACKALLAAGADIDYDGASGPLALTDGGEPAMARFTLVHFGDDNRLDPDAAEVFLGGSEDLAAADAPALPPRDQAVRGDGLAFGTLLPMTGQLVFLGPDMLAAAKLAVSDINAAGGVNGAPVTLVEGDSGDFAMEVADATVDGLLAADVDVIIGAVSSATSLHVIDRVVGDGVVLFSPSNTSNALTDYPDDGLYFRAAPPDTMQARALGGIIRRDGHHRIGILAADDDYGLALSFELADWLREAGVADADLKKMVYDPASDLSLEVLAMKAFAPDAIALIGFDETYDLVTFLNDAGIGPAR